MLFNTFGFLYFFVLVYVIYWSLNGNLKLQNLFILVSSYYFYSCWDYRFLFLLIFSTFLDYFTGLKIANAQTTGHKRAWLIISVAINLGFLGFFKYYNFFIDQFASLLSLMGFKPNLWTLSLILPVGISFYTFHGMSYVFDIYNNKFKPRKSYIDYAVFVSFFPLLVAGPIERASHLLPQVEEKRVFDYNKSVSGLRQILWGLFKKVVIADNCAKYVNQIFDNYQQQNGATLALGAVFFAFQIYGDFSGYSDIALGSARLLGFELLKNFSFPYFSRDIAEFWRRWHISLSSWFRDYIYIPLGGSKVSKIKQVRNTFIIFIVSGFWHGANWTFIVWGFINALYFLPLLLTNRNRKNIEFESHNKAKLSEHLKDGLKIIFTFSLTTFAWIFFRSPSLTAAFGYIKRMFTNGLFQKVSIMPIYLVVLLMGLLVVEWRGRKDNFAIEGFSKYKAIIRYPFYYLIVVLLFIYAGRTQQFIYFQF